jgi:hypothetical protein
MSTTIFLKTVGTLKSWFDYDHYTLPLKRILSFTTILRSPILYFRSKFIYRRYISNLPNANFFKLSRNSGFTEFKIPFETLKEVIYNAQNLQKVGSANRGKKDYMQALTRLDNYDSNSPEFKLATDPSLIKSIQEYLGHAPILFDITVLHSPASKNLNNQYESYQGSQLLHRDADDLNLVKIWILCSDVEKINGPTVLIEAQESHKICRNLKYRQGHKISINTEKKLNLTEFQIKYAVGKTGTTYATDTSRLLHYGSRTSAESDRLVLMFHYVSFYSSYFRKFPKSPQHNRALHSGIEQSKLSKLQKILLRGYLPQK